MSSKAPKPEQPPVEDSEEDYPEDDDEYAEEVDLTSVMFSMLSTPDGESITSVMASIRDALDKQNKILMKLLSAVENKK